MIGWPIATRFRRLLCLIDAFVVRYDADAGDGAELAPHRDAGPLSFNVLLSDGNAFDGGATTFVDADFDGVDEDAGDAVLHPGQTRHGGRRTTRGTRSIAVGFVEIDGFEVNVDGYDGAASERHQRDSGARRTSRGCSLGRWVGCSPRCALKARSRQQPPTLPSPPNAQATPTSRITVAVSTPPSKRDK